MGIRMGQTLAMVGWGVILMAAGLKPAPAMHPCPPQAAKSVRIGHQSWRVTVAATPAQRERGLSGQPALTPGTAMWFVFPEPGIPGFWMRGMRFPLDLAWISPQGRLVAVETLAPCTGAECPIHYPPEPVSFVLEATANTLPEQEDSQITWHCAPD